MMHTPLPEPLARPLGYPSVADLPEEKQKGLRAFWLDGLFASLSSGFADSYYTLYMLSLSATSAQIGLVNSLAQIFSATLALPGAILADRTGRYRQVALTAGIISRLLWLVMIAAPILFDNEQAVIAILLAWVGITGVNTLGNAGWTALTAELVPNRLRGAYFASRNIIIQLARLVSIPIAGQIVGLIGEPRGYQVSLGIAFVVGLFSVYYFHKIPEHRVTDRFERFSLRETLANIKHLKVFKRFMFSHAILQLGVMLGGPFITVYMAEEVHFSVGTIGLVTTVNVLASLLGMRIMGRFHDRAGITWTMRFGIGIPLITIAWLWVQHPWQAYIVNGLAAFTWSGYNLGAFNLLLASTPNEHRPNYIAVYTTIIAVVSATSPLAGGWLLDLTDFTTIFSLSSVIRCLGLIAFFALVREPDSVPDIE